jgi:hypothetical protein
MRFLAITLIVHAPDPVTGAVKPTSDRFAEVISNAQLAEELGFDGFGVGERHERPFISSSPPVVLSHIAALTSRIRLFTAVTTLSLLDPVRAYEDYATLDHLSGGRLELIIGKGNGAAQRELFQVTPEDQWERNAESYELFRGHGGRSRAPARRPASPRRRPVPPCGPMCRIPPHPMCRRPSRRPLPEKDTDRWLSPPWESLTWSRSHRVPPRRRRCATAWIWPGRPRAWAMRATGSLSITSIPAWPGPRRRSCWR